MWYMCLNIMNCLWSTQSRTDTISHPSSRDYYCSKGQTTSATKRHNGAHDGEQFTRHASLKHRRHRQTLGELLVFSDRPRFTLYHHIETAQQYSNRWLVHWPLMGGLLHLVQRGGAWVGWGPVQSPLRCTKCNSPPINGQCTKFILFDLAVKWPVDSKVLKSLLQELQPQSTFSLPSVIQILRSHYPLRFKYCTTLICPRSTQCLTSIYYV